jgi:hypothetical protein
VPVPATYTSHVTDVRTCSASQARCMHGRCMHGLRNLHVRHGWGGAHWVLGVFLRAGRAPRCREWQTYCKSNSKQGGTRSAAAPCAGATPHQTITTE